MAGLGTGAAPFRAFIQHRAWQKSQGIEVGPLVYYFGSRYSSQEYLYGFVFLFLLSSRPLNLRLTANCLNHQ